MGRKAERKNLFEFQYSGLSSLTNTKLMAVVEAMFPEVGLDKFYLTGLTGGCAEKFAVCYKGVFIKFAIARDVGSGKAKDIAGVKVEGGITTHVKGKTITPNARVMFKKPAMSEPGSTQLLDIDALVTKFDVIYDRYSEKCDSVYHGVVTSGYWQNYIQNISDHLMLRQGDSVIFTRAMAGQAPGARVKFNLFLRDLSEAQIKFVYKLVLKSLPYTSKEKQADADNK